MDLLVLFLVGVIALNVDALTIDRQCVDFSSHTVSPEIGWVMASQHWYYPLLSREAANYLARKLVGKAPEQMNPDDVIFQSCISSDSVQDPSLPQGWYKDAVSGYGGAKTYFLYKGVRGFEVFDLCIGDFCERGYLTLTDNQSFLVAVFCTSYGDMKWVAVSNVKTLPEPTKQLIFRHVENLGFKREHFIEQRWDYCL